jgi:hypothetical protein
MLTAATDLVPFAQAAAAIGAGIVLIAFVFLVAAPAWTSYGRLWEKVGAVFLSFYVLAAMLGIGVLAGLGFFYLLGQNI